MMMTMALADATQCSVLHMHISAQQTRPGCPRPARMHTHTRAHAHMHTHPCTHLRRGRQACKVWVLQGLRCSGTVSWVKGDELLQQSKRAFVCVGELELQWDWGLWRHGCQERARLCPGCKNGKETDIHFVAWGTWLPGTCAPVSGE